MLASDKKASQTLLGSKDDEMPRAKGPTTRAMARRIQEE